MLYASWTTAQLLQWPFVRVSQVYSGPGKFVRVVKNRTSTGEYHRHVNKLEKLPLSDVTSQIKKIESNCFYPSHFSL